MTPLSAPNPLELFISLEELDPVATMNLLQDHCVVSDNCVGPEDVANAEEAVKWIAGHWRGNEPV